MALSLAMVLMLTYLSNGARSGNGTVVGNSANADISVRASFGHFVDDLAHLSFPKIPPEQTFNRRVDIKL